MSDRTSISLRAGVRGYVLVTPIACIVSTLLCAMKANLAPRCYLHALSFAGTISVTRTTYMTAPTVPVIYILAYSGFCLIRTNPLGSVLLEKWNAVLSGGEDCNFCVSSPSKLASRDLANHSVCTNVRCPARWVLLSAVPVFWLWLTELDHVLNQPNKRANVDRIEWQQQIENLLVL